MQTQQQHIEAQATATDRDLLEAIRQGSSPAFASLIERYQSVVCGVAFSYLGDRALSEDVAQEVFLGLWRKPDDIHSPDKLAGWLRTVARNRASDVARRRKFETPSDRLCAFAANESSALETITQKQRSQLLWKELRAIPESYREVLVLYYREGDSIHRVAELLEISMDAVKQRLSRGRRKLQLRLQPFLGEALRKSAPTAAFAAVVVSSALAEAGVAKAAAVASHGLLRKYATLLVVGALIVVASVASLFISKTSPIAERDHGRAKVTRTTVFKTAPERLTAHTVESSKEVGGEVLRIEGLVLDSFDDPVAAVRVVAVGDKTYEVATGADGSFVFESLGEKKLHVHAATSDASSATQSLDLSVEPEPVILVLNAGMALTVLVRDPQGKAIGGAHASLFNRAVVTDEDGRARFNGIPPEFGRLVVTAEGFAPSSLTLEGRDGTGEFVREILLRRGFALSGRVLNVDGLLIPDAAVTVVNSLGQEQEVSTDRGGRFEFALLGKGRYHVSARHSQQQSPGVVVDLEKKAVDDLSIVIETESGPSQDNSDSVIKGVVVDELEQPVSGATVRLLRREKTDWSATTNSKGEFLLSDVPPGVSTLRTTWPGESAAYYYLRTHDEQVEAQPGDRLKIQLTTPGTVRAKMRFDDGRSPEVAWVAISTHKAGSMSFAPAIGARGGRVHLKEVPPGTYVLNFFGPDFQPVIREDIVVASGRSTKLGDVIVSRGRMVTGAVVDAGGVPQEGAQVMLLSGRAAISVNIVSTLGRSAALEGKESIMKFGGRIAKTDASGRFVLRGVSEQAGVIWASGSGTRGDTLPVAAGAEDAQIRVVIATGAIIEGRVTDRGRAQPGIVELCDPGDDLLMLCAYEVFVVDDGSYRLEGVAAGTYSVRFRGVDDEFPTHVADEITVDSGETRALDISM